MRGRSGRTTRRTAGVALATAAIAGAGVAQGSAATFHVDARSAVPSPVCATPANACHTIEQALRAAGEAGEGPHVVEVAAGVHTENVLLRHDRPAVTIRGAGAGRTILRPRDRNGAIVGVHGSTGARVESLVLDSVAVTTRANAVNDPLTIYRGGDVVVERSVVGGSNPAGALQYTPDQAPGGLTVRDSRLEALENTSGPLNATLEASDQFGEGRVTIERSRIARAGGSGYAVLLSGMSADLASSLLLGGRTGLRVYSRAGDPSLVTGENLTIDAGAPGVRDAEGTRSRRSPSATSLASRSGSRSSARSRWSRSPAPRRHRA